jgi:hypothetical protein
MVCSFAFLHIFSILFFSFSKCPDGCVLKSRVARFSDRTALQSLTDSTDIEFSPQNKPYFTPHELVKLKVSLKNVKNLLIRIFEIKTLTYYQENGKELDDTIDLDGLSPNWEYTYTFGHPPIQSHEEEFEFPELNRRGVFVIDFTGNGKIGRAVIKKVFLDCISLLTALIPTNHASTERAGSIFFIV